jgi:type II secretory pathway component PulF
MPGRLTPDESAELAQQVADLSRAGLPLPAALRALAAEVPSPRLARVLRQTADRLAAGASLEEAIQSAGRRLPAHLRGLIVAGIRGGRLATVLDEFAVLTHRRQELRRRVAVSLAYPALLLAILALVIAGLHTMCVGDFAELFKGFGVKLPDLTRLLLSVPVAAVWVFSAVVSLPLAVIVAGYLAPPGARLSELVTWVPVVGPLLRWGALAEFCQLMAILLEGQVPLPEALRLAGAGVSSARLAKGCRWAAKEVEGGSPLDGVLTGAGQFPPSMTVLVAWGRQTGAPAEAFRAAAEMFEGRTQSQGSLLEAVLPPVAFLVLISLVGLWITALFLPLISLISNLSGGGM